MKTKTISLLAMSVLFLLVGVGFFWSESIASMLISIYLAFLGFYKSDHTNSMSENFNLKRYRLSFSSLERKVEISIAFTLALASNIWSGYDILHLTFEEFLRIFIPDSLFILLIYRFYLMGIFSENIKKK